tara:strand:- start:83 stop:1000 length:918 start_codon:yes stop_codon:yes gene_type:complete
VKRILGIVILGLLLCNSGFTKTKISEIKKSIKEDNDGILKLKKFHHLNAPHAKNPISISKFSKIGQNSIRFELNDGECGKEPNWNDCDNDRERVELYYEQFNSKKEQWYRFYIYLPKDYNSLAPSKMSLIQWKTHNPSKVLVMFQQMHAGLTFNRNGDTFVDSYVVLKSNEELLGSWTEIIFNTNWHPDSSKGFMKVWIDRKLKVDFIGVANKKKKGQKISLRYGLYSSYLSRYEHVFQNKNHPQRIIFFDGVRAEKTCEKLIDPVTCNKLTAQNIKEYEMFFYGKYDKKLKINSIKKMPSSFLK